MLSFLVLSLAVSAPAIADGPGSAKPRGRLEVSIAPAHPVLGDPLRLTVRAIDAPRPLAELSLAPLRKAFKAQDVVAGHDHVRRNGHSVVAETLTVTLYPLHAGRITVPSLHLGAWSSRGRVVSVAATGPPGEVIRVRRGVERHRLWAREEALVYIDVYDDAKGVLAELPAWHPAGAFVRRLDTRTRRVKEQGTTYNVTRLSWAVMPLHSGPLQLDFPLLQVRSRARFGKRLLYPVAPLHLQARALPGYIPPRVPVGHVHLSEIAPAGRLWPNHPYTWRLRISGTGLDLNSLRSLLGPQLRDSPGLHYYHPLYERIDDDSADPLAQTFRVSVPFVATGSGEHRLPALSLPFFNAKTGRIELTRQKIRVLDISSPFWVGLGWAVAVVTGLVVLAALGAWLRAWLRRRIARRTALRDIAAAARPRQVAAALLAWHPEKAPTPRTLQQWHVQVLERGRRRLGEALAGEITEALAGLQQACYAPDSRSDSGALSDLRARITGIVQRL